MPKSELEKWICCQIGAREHYAIPRALHAGGRLDVLYTDAWAGAAYRKLAHVTGSKVLRRFGGRFHHELKGVRVEAWNLRAFLWEARIRRSLKSADSLGKYSAFVEVGKRFAKVVRNSIRSRTRGGAAIVFAYDTAALEVLEWCAENRIRCIVGQIDPNRLEMELVQKEESRWPDWALQRTEIPEDYVRRRESEWRLAERVVVNSEFSRAALVEQGVPREKLMTIPLSFEMGCGGKARLPRKLSETLRVLWLGQVILRKGIQYLVEAAQCLKGENIRFDIVGPIGISEAAMATAPASLTFHGPVARDQAAWWYDRADVFVLPTISDGFAITQLEAMAHGLPVVTTPCCGDVVSNGLDGFVVPARDSSALAHALRRYLSEPGLLKQHRVSAMAKAGQFTQARLAANLLILENAPVAR